MGLKEIFDVFSRRGGATSSIHDEIPATTRNRIFLWCGDVFSNRRSFSGRDDYTNQFWEEIHRFLQLRHGRGQLSDSRHGASSRAEDAITFLSSCNGTEFLDFLEYIFRVECFFHVALPDAQIVTELNELLRVDNLPYHVTDFVKEQMREVVQGPPPFGGRERTVIKTLAFPMVISRDSEVVHAHVIEPVLKFLQAPAFKSANTEYLEALEDHRKGDLGDCLTKCGSAFESVMKVICERKGWPYKQTDTAGPLVKTILYHTSLDNYLEPVLMIVAALRNRLSKAHGAGVQTRNVPRHLAAYALNSTAAAILLLVAEAGLE
jgi:hypothetical protein